MMITKHASDAFYVVTNAGRATEDLAWFKARLAEWNASERSKSGPVEHGVLEGWGLLALQGASHTKSTTFMVANLRQVLRPRTTCKL
jgi:glycine cleavage system aminomethyltransferase T